MNSPTLKALKKPTLIIALLFAVSNSVIYMPPHFTWFYWQRTLAMLGWSMSGILELPVYVFLSFFSDAPWPALCAMAFAAFFILGLLVGAFTWALWGLGRWGKVILTVVILTNLLIGLVLALVSDVPVEPAQICERFISAEHGIRIIAYPEIGLLPGTVHFYLSTQDGRDTWKQFMVAKTDDYEPQCENVKSLDGEFVWTWTPWSVGVSHDGGLSWQVWQWQCKQTGCNYGAVQSVEFQDRQNGRMSVYPWKGNTSELVTEDGGQTWQSVE